jgi:hypothetical protein
LNWWKEFGKEYPVLSQMALDIFSVPVASVEVERVFSLARDVVSLKRGRLNADTIRGMLLHMWINMLKSNLFS